jgi:hypothetical protein
LSGQSVPNGGGTVTVRTDVTRQNKDGTTVATEDVQLSVKPEGDFLSVTNSTVAGSFDVVAEVVADEGSFRKERVPQPGPPRPGELRPGDRATLGSLGAGVPEAVRDATRRCA